jgi:hypothetical protein
MVYYDDDDEYNYVKSMTPKQVAAMQRHSLPPITEMIETLNTDRHGFLRHVHTWSKKTKNERNKKMLYELEILVTKYRQYLHNNKYKFFKMTVEDDDNMKFDIIIFGDASNKIPIDEII